MLAMFLSQNEWYNVYFLKHFKTQNSTHFTNKDLIKSIKCKGNVGRLALVLSTPYFPLKYYTIIPFKTEGIFE